MPPQEKSEKQPEKPEIKQEIRDDKGQFKPGRSGNPLGKPPGTQNKKTIDKKVAEEEFKNRILLNIQDLLTSQMNIAKGTSYLYKIVTHKGAKGGEGRKEHILVTDPYEIKDFLDELEGESGVNPNTDNDDYYYISTEQPDNRALDSLINRVFGKPKENIDLVVGTKFPIWGQYEERNIPTKALDQATPREPKQVEGSGSSQESREDDSLP